MLQAGFVVSLKGRQTGWQGGTTGRGGREINPKFENRKRNKKD